MSESVQKTEDIPTTTDNTNSNTDKLSTSEITVEIELKSDENKPETEMESRANLLSSASPFAGVEGDIESDSIGGTRSNSAFIDNNQNNQNIWQKSSHPVALTFHLLFRTAALLVYLIGTLFTDNFPFIFISCVLLLAFDFWTVKNVTGRLLVGLRWWNEIQEDGSNMWMFESRDPSRPVNQTDSRIFWISLYVTFVVWAICGIIVLFHPQWLLIVAVALVLNFANVLGYTQCDKDAKKKWATGFAARAATGNAGLAGKLFSASFGKIFG
ncbi:10373_t:CDS:2 [Ambispora leptoticha]|uniref:Golgi apparatus membrane protein TVP23 n=1 Tax=Ambispora leptoticha TaxID=144679 RepID=A0A9N8YS70_9GLOM|nr:10373_t:CDS:2 [Ambispora leptoticha]